MLGRQIYFFSKNNCIISVHTEQTRQLVGFEKYIFKGHFCSPVHVAEKLNYISFGILHVHSTRHFVYDTITHSDTCIKRTSSTSDPMHGQLFLLTNLVLTTAQIPKFPDGSLFPHSTANVERHSIVPIFPPLSLLPLPLFSLFFPFSHVHIFFACLFHFSPFQLCGGGRGQSVPYIPSNCYASDLNPHYSMLTTCFVCSILPSGNLMRNSRDT